MILTSDLMAILPEMILFIGAMLLLMLGVFAADTKTCARQVNSGAILLLLLAVLVAVLQMAEEISAFNNALQMDGFTSWIKMLVFVGVAISLLMARGFMEREEIQRFEFPILAMLATAGMGIMVSANDMIALYMGLELQSLALYVVAAINRESGRSTEAGLKYFVLGALSSGMLLYGISLIYGFAGTVNFTELAAIEIAENTTAQLGLIFGLVFLIAGLAFKISAVPFHMWTPDVYEGAPTPVTALFAAAPKIAAMALFMRVIIGAFPHSLDAWQQIIIFMAVASMGLGAFAAIGQSNIKRLMAYSSIGHMGFALVGFAALGTGATEGAMAVIIYMSLYVLMSLGVFACILSMRNAQGMLENIHDLAGLSKTQPLLAFCLAALMFSLAGIPPLGGFFAKFYVFRAAINADLIGLAIIGILCSVVGAYYYLRVVKIIYLDAPRDDAILPMPVELKTIALIATIILVLFFVYPAPMVAMGDMAARALLFVPVAH